MRNNEKENKFFLENNAQLEMKKTNVPKTRQSRDIPKETFVRKLVEKTISKTLYCFKHTNGVPFPSRSLCTVMDLLHY